MNARTHAHTHTFSCHLRTVGQWTSGCCLCISLNNYQVDVCRHWAVIRINAPVPQGWVKPAVLEHLFFSASQIPDRSSWWPTATTSSWSTSPPAPSARSSPTPPTLWPWTLTGRTSTSTGVTSPSPPPPSAASLSTTLQPRSVHPSVVASSWWYWWWWLVDGGGSCGDDVEGSDGNVGSVSIAYQLQASQRHYSQGLSIHRWWRCHYGGGADDGDGRDGGWWWWLWWWCWGCWW